MKANMTGSFLALSLSTVVVVLLLDGVAGELSPEVADWVGLSVNGSSSSAGNHTEAPPAAQCRYPCLMKNGCTCDGTQPYEDNGQNFGTCSSCSSGWGGWDCATVVQTCLHGWLNHTRDNRSTCICPDGWAGPRCGDFQCLHSHGGKGPDSVAPVNSENNQCEECEVGWEGMNCELCTKTKVCPNGTTCNGSMVPVEPHQAIECEITDKTWVMLLGDMRPGVKGYFKTSWDKPSGWNASLTMDGTAHVSLWRLEPEAVWLDPFFYCSFQNCSAFITSKEIPATVQKPPPVFRQLQNAVSIALYGVLTAFFVNAFIPVRFTKLRNRVMTVSTVLLLIGLVFYLIFFSQFGHEVITPSKKETTVDYQCLESTCECAPDPKNFSWQYWCIGSFVGKNVLPNVKGEVHFQCDYETQICDLYAASLLNGEKIAGSCSAGTCVNDSLLPPRNKNNAGLNPKHAVILATIPVGVIIGLLLLHWIFDHVRRQQKNRIFLLRYSEPLRTATTGTATATTTAGGERLPRNPSVASSIQQPPSLKQQQQQQPLLGDSANDVRGSSMWERAEEESVSLCTQNLSYRVSGKQILHGTTMNITSGSTLALMGPSGAGKTTLLDLLAMRTKDGIVGGTVTLNGEEVGNHNSTGERFKHLLGYVAQEDTLIPALTVRQTVYFAARLKLPAPISDSVISQLVDETLERLYLTKCQHTQVGDEHRRGISGGEKRRVSIATELVASPRILVLDEPTSGLDSISAFEVIRAVTAFARRSHMPTFARFFKYRPIIVFSIHQPSESIYRMFDQVCLLQDGFLVYCGPAQQALQRLQKGVNHPQHHRNSSSPGPVPETLARLRVDSDTVGSDRFRVESLSRLPDKSPESVPAPNGARAIVPISNSFDAEDDDLPPSPTVFTNQAEALLRLTHDLSGTTDLKDVSHRACKQAEKAMERREAEAATNPSYRPTLREMESAVVKYRPSVWQQFSILATRTGSALLGSYHLVSSHALFTLFLGIALSFLYASEKLDLSGTENKAGLLTFILLVVSFSSLSCLELFIAERRLFEVEHENGYYGVLTYFTVKLLFDFIPLRILPTAVLGACIYFPVGMRTDDGSYFLWFVEVLTVFSLATTSLSLIVAIIAPAFGPAALFASLLVLWNTAFGGLMIQGDTIPSFFLPFRHISPTFYAYESLMVNELLGQKCTLDPVSSDGIKQKQSVPIDGITFLYNLGLDPNHFGRDVAVLHAQTCITIICAFVFLFIRVKIPRMKAILRGLCRRSSAPSPSSSSGHHANGQRRETAPAGSYGATL